jgi:hypothetical protein
MAVAHQAPASLSVGMVDKERLDLGLDRL